MGYNRAGNRRTNRLRRAKRYEERLARKAAQQELGGKGQGLLAKVKEVAKEAVATVEGAVQSVVDTVRGNP